MIESPENTFIEAAVWHGSFEEADVILAAYPEIATSNIHTAAVLGDDRTVRRFLALDPASATAKGGLREWDALTHLCFSKYLRLDPARSAAFVRAAEALLDAGAHPNTGFYDNSHRPVPAFESALYGAAGVAHHPELTRLLLDCGANPNDDEVPYHSPEGYDNAALKVLVESGKLTADSLTTMLIRKADWHDREGIRYLLEHGADPNGATQWHVTAFHQALRRDNALGIIELFLDHGADSAPVVIAARRGRRDVLELFKRRGIPLGLHGVDQLIAACAVDDVPQQPSFRAELLAEGGKLLAEFAGNGNTDGICCLLDLGVDVRAIYPLDDNYFGIAKGSTALHVAAWRANHSTVKFLIERGAVIDALDAEGRTPLTLAVKACVDSYWSDNRSPESVQALLDAGASAAKVKFPSGYGEVDDLLIAAEPLAGR